MAYPMYSNNLYMQDLTNMRDRIDQQIRQAQQMQAQPMQQPITQNFQLASTGSTIDFEARYVKDNEDISNILVNHRTAFIDLNKGKLSIKEENGDIKEYPIILPKSEKDLKIEELEKNNALLNQKLNEMEMKLNANTQFIQPTNEVERQTSNVIKSNKK